MNAKVAAFLDKAPKWGAEMRELRRIVLECGLQEDFKWRNPCYTLDGKNVVIIGAFKEYCCLSFFKGSLLKDPNNLLQSPGENSRSVRIVPFTSVTQIEESETTLKSYIHEAMALEKSGAKVPLEESEPLAVPKELQDIMGIDPEFKKAFYTLTPGRQRGYLIYFNGAKQEKTRKARIEKYKQRILAGKGLNDCVCGHSKKMPACDGSHKYL